MARSTTAVCLALMLLAGAINLGETRKQSREEANFMGWLRDEGAVLKAEIGYNVNGTRGLFATEDIEPGTGPAVLIPPHAIFSVPMLELGSAMITPYLTAELHSGCSRYKPYWDMLPNMDHPGEAAVNGYNFPPELIPHLGSDQMEYIIGSYRESVAAVFNKEHDLNIPKTLGEALGDDHDLTLEEFADHVAMLAGRAIPLKDSALGMVPMVDMANHNPVDPNCYVSTNSAGAAMIICERGVKKGEELSVSYGPHLRDDEALLTYGFVNHRAEPQLAAVDHHEYYDPNTQEPGQVHRKPFDGTPDEIEQEIARLTVLLEVMENKLRDAGPMPLPEGKEWFADVVQAFQNRRRASLEAEIARLQARFADGGVADQADGGVVELADL